MIGVLGMMARRGQMKVGGGAYGSTSIDPASLSPTLLLEILSGRSTVNQAGTIVSVGPVAGSALTANKPAAQVGPDYSVSVGATNWNTGEIPTWLELSSQLIFPGAFTVGCINTRTAGQNTFGPGGKSHADGDNAAAIGIDGSNIPFVYDDTEDAASSFVPVTLAGRCIWFLWRDASNVVRFRSNQTAQVSGGTVAGTLTLSQLGRFFDLNNSIDYVYQDSALEMVFATATDLSASIPGIATYYGFTLA